MAPATSSLSVTLAPRNTTVLSMSLKTGRSSKTDRMAWHRLLLAVEEAKIELSRREEAEVYLDNPLCEDEAGKAVEVRVPITRSAFEKLIASDVERAVHICHTLLQKNRMSGKDIDQLILIGGPTKIPYVQHVLGGQWLGVARPAKLGPLASTQGQVAFGSHLQHLHFHARVHLDGTDKSVAFAQQEVAHVERNGHAVLDVQSPLSVTLFVVVFDIVVNQRGLVKALYRHGKHLQPQRRPRRRVLPIALQSHIDACC